MSAKPDTGPIAPKSPKKKWHRFEGSATDAITVILGALIISLTLVFHAWVINAQSVYRNLATVESAFDQIVISDLVFVYDLCDLNGDAISQEDFERFARTGRLIQKSDSILLHTQGIALELINGPFWQSFLPFDLLTKPVAVSEELTELPLTDVKQTQLFSSSTGEKVSDICSKFRADRTDLATYNKLHAATLEGVSSGFDLVAGGLMFSGKGPGANEILVQKLRTRQAMVTQWGLPVLHGSLGAIVFCLFRILNSKEKNPKLGEVILRLVFGGFVGLLVSTLILPSGVVAFPFSGSAPGVSLLAFIFGYSLDSFIQLLERLNSMVVEATRPNP